MTQSTSLFIGNIRDNLLVAKADATDEEIYTALKKASFYDYVMSLPDKLDNLIFCLLKVPLLGNGIFIFIQKPSAI